ncbi:MAG: CoA ester lyase [Alphaproteobacteria bacterium]|jgi:citrate lyase subunit beta / citryl-CoA lyase|nr:MAG: CoA ester lyase [Alphaproteobacteria bacterium]
MNWRSMLFVPAAAPQRWSKAHTRGADAIIVDLEDSTQPEAKAAARAQAREAVQTLHANGAIVTVRVNNDPEHIEADLEAAVVGGLTAIVMPKVEAVSELEGLSAQLDALEYENGLDRYTIGVMAVIESPRALERITSIADAPRLIGISLGSEDFSLSLGRPPAPLSLGLAAQTIAYAASARGIMGIGMATGIANFTDLDAFAAEARRSHAMGLTGAMCIHPNQIAVLNECFGVSDEAVAEARAILAAWETRVDGVVSHNGRMIDQPVVERARRLLTSAGLA